MATETDRTLDLHRALADPTRQRVLQQLHDTGSSWAAKLGRELDLKTPTVKYHLDILAECGCAERLDRAVKRGGLATIFRATMQSVISDADWERRDKLDRSGLATEAIKAYVADLDRMLDSGTLANEDDEKIALLRLPLRDMDEEGLVEVVHYLARTSLPEIEGIAIASQQRRARLNRRRVNVSVFLGGMRVPGFDQLVDADLFDD